MWQDGKEEVTNTPDFTMTSGDRTKDSKNDAPEKIYSDVNNLDEIREKSQGSGRVMNNENIRKSFE